MSKSKNKLKESEIRSSLIENFKQWDLREELEKALPFKAPVKLREKVRIPYRIWFEPRVNSSENELDPVLQVRHYEQDIVFFIETDIRDEKLEGLNFHNTRNEYLILPLLIVEVKRGASTHDLITYSRKANAIRNIFPFSKYVLVAGAARTRKWNLQGEDFDAIHGLGSLAEKEDWDRKTLRKKLERQISRIGQDLNSFKSSGKVSDSTEKTLVTDSFFALDSTTKVKGDKPDFERHLLTLPEGELRNFVEYLTKKIYKTGIYEKIDLTPETRISFYKDGKVPFSIWNGINSHLKEDEAQIIFPRAIDKYPLSKSSEHELKSEVAGRLNGVAESDIDLRRKGDMGTIALRLYSDTQYVVEEFLNLVREVESGKWEKYRN